MGFWRKALAIKRLDKDDKETPKSFCRELMIASSLQHPNIVPLLGFCIDQEQGLFLVYKYVSGGSLEHYLHGNLQLQKIILSLRDHWFASFVRDLLVSCLFLDKMKKGNKNSLRLPWSARYKIALGIADAIAYLHSGTDQCVVHRDIKPSNILLSSNKKPKVMRLRQRFGDLLA